MRFGCLMLAIWALGMGGTGSVAGASEQELPALRFDPFARPDLERAEAAPVEDAAEWHPILKATLVAGTESMANLGGVILKLGEEAYGYRLVEVGPWQAIFERAGDRIELPVVREDGS